MGNGDQRERAPVCGQRQLHLCRVRHLHKDLFSETLGLSNIPAYLPPAEAFEPTAPRVHARQESWLHKPWYGHGREHCSKRAGQGGWMPRRVPARHALCSLSPSFPLSPFFFSLSLSLSLSLRPCGFSLERIRGLTLVTCPLLLVTCKWKPPVLGTPRAGHSCPTNSGKKMNTS
jgi:hypothetical protein